jgi:hypothetical protein
VYQRRHQPRGGKWRAATAGSRSDPRTNSSPSRYFLSREPQTSIPNVILSVDAGTRLDRQQRQGSRRHGAITSRAPSDRWRIHRRAGARGSRFGHGLGRRWSERRRVPRGTGAVGNPRVWPPRRRGPGRQPRLTRHGSP